MRFIKIFIIMVISLLSINCATNQVTGKMELFRTTRIVETNRDKDIDNVFYLKMVISNVNDSNTIQAVIASESNTIARLNGYESYDIIDVNVVDEGLSRYFIYEVKFTGKIKPSNPCNDEIFEIVQRKGTENLSDREFDLYKLKTQECNELQKRHEMKKQRKMEKNQKTFQTQALWGLALIIWIIYAY